MQGQASGSRSRSPSPHFAAMSAGSSSHTRNDVMAAKHTTPSSPTPATPALRIKIPAVQNTSGQQTISPQARSRSSSPISPPASARIISQSRRSPSTSQPQAQLHQSQSSRPRSPSPVGFQSQAGTSRPAASHTFSQRQVSEAAVGTTHGGDHAERTAMSMAHNLCLNTTVS